MCRWNNITGNKLLYNSDNTYGCFDYVECIWVWIYMFVCRWLYKS